MEQDRGGGAGGQTPRRPHREWAAMSTPYDQTSILQIDRHEFVSNVCIDRCAVCEARWATRIARHATGGVNAAAAPVECVGAPQAEIMTAAELCGNNQGLVKMYQPALMAPAPGALCGYLARPWL